MTGPGHILVQILIQTRWVTSGLMVDQMIPLLTAMTVSCLKEKIVCSSGLTLIAYLQTITGRRFHKYASAWLENVKMVTQQQAVQPPPP